VRSNLSLFPPAPLLYPANWLSRHPHGMRVGQNTAFLLLIFGVLLVYGEFLRPGRLVPGLVGSTMAITGAYSLWRNSPLALGGLLIMLAVLLLMAEAVWEARFIPGILGTISLAAGFSLLFPSERRIAPTLAIPASIVLGGVSTFLAFEAKRARQNKRSDL
jgi:membrane-bound serine protease (ClpP class)